MGLMPVEAATSARNLERELLERIRSGGPEAEDAFETIVRTHQKRVFRFVLSMVRDSSEADCVTQEVFVKAYRSLTDFKGDAALETWLTRIAINAVRDRMKRKHRPIPFSQLGDPDEDDAAEIPARLDPGTGTSPERDLIASEIRRRVGEALTTLSPRQRAVFILKYYEERSIAEIGAATGLDEGTIKSHLFRAARKLRGRLEDLR